jgi:hypothetical protein
VSIKRYIKIEECEHPNPRCFSENTKILCINASSFNEKMKAPNKLVINNNSFYTLESCIISLGGHSICGITCNGKKYVYDSNNYLTEDTWNEGGIPNYVELVKDVYGYNTENGYKKENIRFSVLIYIKDN